MSVPDHIEEKLADESITDVTDQYPELIETFVDLAHNRTNPIPIDHVVVYTEPDTDGVIVAVSVDTDLDGEVGFELALGEAFAEQFDGGDLVDDQVGENVGHGTMVLDSFMQHLRVAEETIWREAVNIDGDE